MIKERKKFDLIEDGIYRLKVVGFRDVPKAPYGPSDAVDFVVETEGKFKGRQWSELIGRELVIGTKYDKFVTAINAGVPFPTDVPFDTDCLIGRSVDAVIKILTEVNKLTGETVSKNKLESLVPIKTIPPVQFVQNQTTVQQTAQVVQQVTSQQSVTQAPVVVQDQVNTTKTANEVPADVKKGKVGF